MKNIVIGFVSMVLIGGCAKKITPANNGSSTSNTQPLPAGTTAGSGSEVTMVINNQGGSAAPKTETPADATAIAAGQNTFNAKCGRCHGLKNPGDFTAERWEGIMDAMAPKAHLTDIEKANVYAYVKANAKK